MHGGSSPGGIKGGQRELAVKAVAKLGLPLGNGDPFVLLEHTVQHAEGYLAATSAALAAIDADDPDVVPLITDVTIAADLYEEAIRLAGRTGKAAVDAKVADRQVAIDLAMANLLNRFIGEFMDRFVPRDQRPTVELWAKGRFAELAHEYERAGRVH